MLPDWDRFPSDRSAMNFGVNSVTGVQREIKRNLNGTLSLPPTPSRIQVLPAGRVTRVTGAQLQDDGVAGLEAILAEFDKPGTAALQVRG